MALIRKKVGVVTGVALVILLPEQGAERILVTNTRHAEPMLKIPGGTIERGETAESAAVREIYEETGLVIKKEDLLFLLEHKYEHPWHPHSFWVFAAVVPNFDTVLKRAVEDGEAKILPRICSNEEVVGMLNGDTRDGKLVPIHKTMLDMGLQIIDAETCEA